MPKEKINDTVGSFDVMVGWQPDCEVQVGVETSAGFSLVSMLYGDKEALQKIALDVYGACQTSEAPQGGGGLHAGEQADALGRRILDIVEASQTSPGSPSYTGVWATLGRHQCNRLIRVLRSARDKAYGRDE